MLIWNRSDRKEAGGNIFQIFYFTKGKPLLLQVAICCLLANFVFAGNANAESTDKSVKTSCSSHELTKDELDAFLVLVKERFGRIHSLKTCFIQEKHLSIFDDVIKAEGMCLFQKPGTIRMDFTEPFRSSLIIKDDSVTKYEFVDGQWEKLDLVGKEIILMVMKNILSWLQGQFNENGIYDISARRNKKVILTLAPINVDFRKYIKYFELGINEKQEGIEYIVIMESRGDYTKINFVNEVINSELPADFFNKKKSTPSSISPW